MMKRDLVASAMSSVSRSASELVIAYAVFQHMCIRRYFVDTADTVTRPLLDISASSLGNGRMVGVAFASDKVLWLRRLEPCFSTLGAL